MDFSKTWCLTPNSSVNFFRVKQKYVSPSDLLTFNGGLGPVIGNIYYFDDFGQGITPISSHYEGVGINVGNNSQSVQSMSFANSQNFVLFGSMISYGFSGASYEGSILNPFGLTREGLMSLTDDPILINIIKDLFRAGGKVPGGTAGAARYTALTAELIGDSDHIKKMADYSRSLAKYIANPGAARTDIQVAEIVLNDLKAVQNDIGDALRIAGFVGLFFNPLAQ